MWGCNRGEIVTKKTDLPNKAFFRFPVGSHNIKNNKQNNNNNNNNNNNTTITQSMATVVEKSGSPDSTRRARSAKSVVLTKAKRADRFVLFLFYFKFIHKPNKTRRTTLTTTHPFPSFFLSFFLSFLYHQLTPKFFF